MLFKTSKPFLKKFNPDGGGNGGGGNQMIIAVDVLKPDESKYKDEVKSSVLLVRLLTDKSTCGCGSKIPLGLSPKIIAEITEESIEKVFSKLKKSLHEKVRADLKLGVSEYIEDLKELLSNYFCEKDIEFSVAKIN